MAGEAPTKDRYFQLVDCLRALAALSVLTLHVISHAKWTTFPTTGPLSIFRNGWEGVDLFFVISGFVVLYNALSIRDRYRSAYLRTFALRRAIRIVPLFYLTIAAYLLFIDDNRVLSHSDAAANIGEHLLFIHTFFLDSFSSIDGVNWTIAIEAQFYVVVALFAFVEEGSAALAALVAAIPLAWAWRYWSYVHFYGSTPMDHYRMFTISAQLPGHIDEFALGMAVALLARGERFQTWRSAAPLIAIIGVAFFWLGNHPPQGMGAPLWFASVNTFLGVAFALIVAAAALVATPLLISAASPLRYLGKISYGIYLWQLLPIMLLKGHGLTPPIFYVIALGATVALAALSWHFVESPLIRVGRRWEARLIERDCRVSAVLHDWHLPVAAADSHNPVDM